MRCACTATSTAAYKRPKRIEFRRELPRTAIGKVLRRKLKEEAMLAAREDSAVAQV
jgi:long-chain acyl-CoA synthetase